MSYLNQNPKSILNAILIIFLVGVVFILWMDRLIDVETITETRLYNLNNLIGSLGFIVSVITIYLLYINYRQSQEEFNKLNIANNKANEIQLILYEKRKLDTNFNEIDLKRINKILNAFFIIEMEVNSSIMRDSSKLKIYREELYKVEKDIEYIRREINLISEKVSLIKKVITIPDVYNVIHTSIPNIIRSMKDSLPDEAEYNSLIKANFENKSNDDIDFSSILLNLQLLNGYLNTINSNF